MITKLWKLSHDIWVLQVLLEISKILNKMTSSYEKKASIQNKGFNSVVSMSQVSVFWNLEKQRLTEISGINFCFVVIKD